MGWHSMQLEPVTGIWGLGREGLSVSRFLSRQGRRMLAVDEQDSLRPDGLAKEAEFYSGGSLDRLLTCSVVVASPGVPRVHPFRQILESRGIEVTTATNLWMQDRAQNVVGVTGTKGKSTTSSLVLHLLQAGGVRSELGGNIGIPLTDITDPGGVTVAEMSSYQCAYLERSPRIAVVTNLYQDHLPWHGSLRQYWMDKCRIFTQGAQVLVCNLATLDALRGLGVALPSTVKTPDDPSVSGIDTMVLPASLSAPHNVENLKLALLAAAEVPGFELDLTRLAGILLQYKGLSHRLEEVSERDNRTWIDDSLSTTTESVVAAIESFDGRELVLIVGGMDRGIDYGPLEASVASRLPAIHVVCLPDNGLEMVATYRHANSELVHSAATMDDAVSLARKVSSPGSVIVMSPGAPSHNAYRNYEEKSQAYVRAVVSMTDVAEVNEPS